MRYVLGIDIGTSSTKSVLLSEAGDVVAVGQQPYDFETPHPGWAEQEPELWWNATKSTIVQVLQQSSADPQKIQAIGFSGQMHGPVFLDAEGQSIRPAIIWADQRSTAECREIYDRLGTEGLYETVGNPVDSGFMAATLLWLKTHEPAHYAKIATLLLPKDYVKFRLSGERVTDHSDAGGTSLYDIRARQWSTTLFERLALSPEIFPRLAESSDIIGTVSQSAAAETGLAAGIPLVNGGNDQTMGALASGAIEEGPVVLAIGTGGTLFTTVDSVVVDPELRMHTYPHCIPNTWHLLGAILAGGLNVKWFRNILDPPDDYSYADMAAEAATAPLGAEGVMYLPYLAGERTPHMDSFARGVMFGMTVRHTRAHLMRAIMEGVVFAMRDCLELFKSLNVHPESIIAAGGGAQSPLWRQIQADVLGLPLVTVNTPEKSATGAAMLAGIGAGCFASFEDACRQTVTYGEQLEPIAENIQRYEECYRFYTSLYPAVKTRFSELAALGR